MCYTFEMVDTIYHNKLQLNKTNTTATEAMFINI